MATKNELISLIQSKKGFVRIVSDELANDAIPNDPVEKRVVQVEHSNTDGTAGITNVFYLHDTANDVAKFYNTEPVAFDVNELNAMAKKQEALENYLKGKYDAYFLGRTDLVNNWAEADVFSVVAGKLNRKSILVFKKGANPISDIDVVIA